MQRSERAEVPRPGLAPVALDHRVPIVARAVREPRLGLARGEGDGHERRPEVVGAEPLAGHVAAPTRRCLECADQYNPGFVSVDRDGYLDDPRYIESLPDDSPLKATENVFAFSLGAASLQLLQLLSMVVGPSGVHEFGGQTFHMTTGTIDLDVARCRPGCPYGALVGLGDRAGNPGTGARGVALVVRNGRPKPRHARASKAV